MSLTCLTIYNIDNTDDKSRVQLTFLYVLFTVTFFTDVTTLDVDDVLQVHDEHEADDNVDENKIDIYPMEMNVIVTNVDEVSELQFNVLDNSTNNENGFDAKRMISNSMTAPKLPMSLVMLIMMVPKMMMTPKMPMSMAMLTMMIPTMVMPKMVSSKLMMTSKYMKTNLLEVLKKHVKHTMLSTNAELNLENLKVVNGKVAVIFGIIKLNG